MDSSSSEQEDAAPFKPFTKKERIQQLNAIDKSVTQLLQSAGLALKTLASSKENAEVPLPQRRDAFQANSDNYFETLQVIDVGLQRQILGLEEADIIPDGKKGAQPGAKSGGGNEPTEGRLGKLDIGWLNSRSGVVDRNMEIELWKTSRKVLEDSKAGEGHRPKDSEDDEVEMVT